MCLFFVFLSLWEATGRAELTRASWKVGREAAVEKSEATFPVSNPRCRSLSDAEHQAPPTEVTTEVKRISKIFKRWLSQRNYTVKVSFAPNLSQLLLIKENLDKNKIAGTINYLLKDYLGRHFDKFILFIYFYTEMRISPVNRV